MLMKNLTNYIDTVKQLYKTIWLFQDACSNHSPCTDLFPSTALGSRQWKQPISSITDYISSHALNNYEGIHVIFMCVLYYMFVVRLPKSIYMYVYYYTDIPKNYNFYSSISSHY